MEPTSQLRSMRSETRQCGRLTNATMQLRDSPSDSNRGQGTEAPLAPRERRNRGRPTAPCRRHKPPNRPTLRKRASIAPRWRVLVTKTTSGCERQHGRALGKKPSDHGLLDQVSVHGSSDMRKRTHCPTPVVSAIEGTHVEVEGGNVSPCLSRKRHPTSPCP